jgi:hypothetical protein
MVGIERLREALSVPPTPEQIRQRASEGWRLVAVEWERPAIGERGDGGELKLEIPFGLKIAADCCHLEEHPVEKEAMTLMLEMIVEDRSLSEVARGLNQREFQTRDGRAWTQTDVFYMLPRLIEAAPHIFSSEEWQHRRLTVADRMAELLG